MKLKAKIQTKNLIKNHLSKPSYILLLFISINFRDSYYFFNTCVLCHGWTVILLDRERRLSLIPMVVPHCRVHTFMNYYWWRRWTKFLLGILLGIRMTMTKCEMPLPINMLKQYFCLIFFKFYLVRTINSKTKINIKKFIIQYYNVNKYCTKRGLALLFLFGP